MEEDKASVIIKFKDGMTKANIDFVTALEADIKQTYPAINAISAIVPKKRLGNIQADPNVEYIEMDYEARIMGFVGNYPTPMAQTTPWGIQKIRSPEVWPSGNKGTGIKVCVIDTGIDYNHEDLKSNYKGGRNFLNNTDNPMDDHGHGTHVAGTIAALDNDVGVIGVAPEASIYSCKVLNSSGSGSYSNIIAAIQWAIDNKMQVISMSLGGSSYSQALEDICNAAYNAGIVIVAAAGNSGSDTDKIGYPAKYDACIAIGATDSNDVRASFSSVGPKLEVCAPGVGVLSSVPKGSCSMCDPSGYKQANGTSMATPHTAGAVALVLKAHPEMTNVNVRKALSDTAVHLGTPGRNIQYGYGRIDVKAAVDQTPSKRYKCSGAPDYQCTEDPNGQYYSLAECQVACVQQKKYRCTGSPDYQCIEDPNGPYNSLAECQTACQAPGKKYRCSGSPYFQCVEDPNGPYNSLAECQAVCKAPVTKYRCTGAPNYQCVEDPNGPYSSLAECQAACKPSPQTKKFKVHTVGSTGMLVMKSTRGDYTADEACKFVCDALKNMDQ